MSSITSPISRLKYPGTRVPCLRVSFHFISLEECSWWPLGAPGTAEPCPLQTERGAHSRQREPPFSQRKADDRNAERENTFRSQVTPRFSVWSSASRGRVFKELGLEREESQRGGGLGRQLPSGRGRRRFAMDRARGTRGGSQRSRGPGPGTAGAGPGAGGTGHGRAALVRDSGVPQGGRSAGLAGKCHDMTSVVKNSAAV